MKTKDLLKAKISDLWLVKLSNMKYENYQGVHSIEATIKYSIDLDLDGETYNTKGKIDETIVSGYDPDIKNLFDERKQRQVLEHLENYAINEVLSQIEEDFAHSFEEFYDMYGSDMNINAKKEK